MSIELLKQAAVLKITDPNGEETEWHNIVFYTDLEGVHILERICWPWVDIGKVEVIPVGQDPETVGDPINRPEHGELGDVPEVGGAGAHDPVPGDGAGS